MGRAVNMRDAWENEAGRWVAWARDGRDSYWRFHTRAFLDLLPPGRRRALDMGCGEGRLPRDLRARGHDVVGIDGSPTLIEHARRADPAGEYRVADAAALPFSDRSFDLVTAFMSLHDIDDLRGAVREAARVLVPGGYFCMAIVHPLSSAGRFESPDPDAAFVIRDSYLEHRRTSDTCVLGELKMTFHSVHRPLGDYVSAVTASGMLLDRLVELPDLSDPPASRWGRIPLFLDLRAIRTEMGSA